MAGFEPTTSSSRTPLPGRLPLTMALAPRDLRTSERWRRWLSTKRNEATAGHLRAEHMLHKYHAAQALDASVGSGLESNFATLGRSALGRFTPVRVP